MSGEKTGTADPVKDDEDESIPSPQECQEASEQFADITGTDTALAMFYLQDVKWRLEPAVNKYFADQEKNALTSNSSFVVVSGEGENSDSVALIPSRTGKEQGENSSHSSANSSNPRRMRILSWNVDGLDTGSLIMRTKGVCMEIEREDPDVVFLQEVVPDSYSIIESTLVNFKCIPAGGEGYFVVVLLKNTTATYQDHCIEPFGQSRMGRHLLMVKCRLRGVDIMLMTSHLESMKSYSTERQRQLKICFQHMSSPPEPKRFVIFGGDLNIRDSELEKIGGLPPHVVDLWEAGGKRKEARFTWDMALNDNKEMNPNVKFKCRSRFDRLYLRQAPDRSATLKPVYFELAGIKRLSNCQRYCSDHWAILAHLDINA